MPKDPDRGHGSPQGLPSIRRDVLAEHSAHWAHSYEIGVGVVVDCARIDANQVW
jgi:hypothetical protein